MRRKSTRRSAVPGLMATASRGEVVPSGCLTCFDSSARTASERATAALGTRSLARRPVQVFVQELERPLAVDGVAAVEVLDLRSIVQTELRVEPSNLRVLVRHPL